MVSLRGILRGIDHLAQGADPDQLRQSGLFLGVELERQARQHGACAWEGQPHGRVGRCELSPLDELFEYAQPAQVACEREIGGRSL